MNSITVDKEIVTGLYLTQAGALALATPCANKEYVSNNRRDADGRAYIQVTHKDDTNISVQFAALPSETNTPAAIMAAFEALFEGGKSAQINGVNVLLRNVGNVSMSGAALVFSANLIKLA